MHHRRSRSTTRAEQSLIICVKKRYDTQCRSVAANAMNNLIDALTSLLRPVPALELSIPGVSPGSYPPISMVFMSEKIDAKLKTTKGRLQPASGDLTGDLGDKAEEDSKQVQGCTMDTLADPQKPRYKGYKDS
jgi:uncharacterized protein YjbJ (UPF0337 family)